MSRIDDLNAKIAQEQAQLADFEAKREDMNNQRSAALEAGDNGKLDKLEAEIAKLNVWIARSRERIKLLRQRLTDVQAEEQAAQHKAHMDRVAERAARARKIGVDLVNEYRKAATVVADMMRKLVACEEVINTANKTLAANGLDLIEPVNTVRCRTGGYRKDTQRVRLGVGDQRHPMYGKATLSQNNPMVAYDNNGDAIDTFGEFDIEVTEFIPSISPNELYLEVNLPEVMATELPIWASDLPPSEEVIQQTIEALGLSDKPAAAQTLGSRIKAAFGGDKAAA